MKLNTISSPSFDAALAARPTTPAAPKVSEDDQKARETFDDFVGQTFYGQMLKALRSSQKKPAYFHGGRAEEVFRNQLDQMLSEQMAKASADDFTGPMFEQFMLDVRRK